jgi:hypothetical protein
MQGGVIILVHCTPPQYDLSTYEVSSWYLKYFLRYAPDKIVGRKDGRTDSIILSISPAAFRRGIIKVRHHQQCIIIAQNCAKVDLFYFSLKRIVLVKINYVTFLTGVVFWHKLLLNLLILISPVTSMSS